MGSLGAWEDLTVSCNSITRTQLEGCKADPKKGIERGSLKVKEIGKFRVFQGVFRRQGMFSVFFLQGVFLSPLRASPFGAFQLENNYFRTN